MPSGFKVCAECADPESCLDEPQGCGWGDDTTGTVLEEAARLVDGDRQDAYGHPRDNHACTAAMWTAYFKRAGVLKDDTEITPRQVCIANALQKCSRDAHTEKRDNLVDLAGWAANAEMVD